MGIKILHGNGTELESKIHSRRPLTSPRSLIQFGIRNVYQLSFSLSIAISSRMNCLYVRTFQKSMQDSLRLSQYTDYGILDLFLTNLGNLFRRIGDSWHLTCQNCTLEIAINVWSHMGPMVSLPRLGDIFPTYESRRT